MIKLFDGIEQNIKPRTADYPLFRNYLNNQKLAEGTIKVYCTVVTKFLTEAKDVTDLEEYNNFLIRYSVKKNNYNYHYALKWFIKFRINNPKQREYLLKGLLHPKLKDPIIKRYELREDEIINIIKELQKPKHKLIAKLQVATGARVHEILMLKRDEIFDEVYQGKLMLRVLLRGKGGKRSVSYIFDREVIDDLFKYFISHYAKTDYIFLDEKKHLEEWNQTYHTTMKLNYSDYWLDLKQAIQTCGYPKDAWSTHDFRRNFAKKLYEKFNRDIYLLQQALRHRDINTTARYLKFSGLNIKSTLEQMQQRHVKVLKPFIEGTKEGDILPVEGIHSTILNDYVRDGVLQYI